MAGNRFVCMEKFNTPQRVAIAVLVGLLVVGLLSAQRIEHEGHWITGMNNQVVWGLPHVFAIFLIVTASGILNVASISSLFGNSNYSAFARLSGLLSITLLVGGLAVLVLDLGRPDRLVIAMTHYNFKSIFAWNIFLYTGFMLVVAAYLWMMFEPRMNRYVRKFGVLALGWRIVLTAGTGSIFGFLVARDAYDSAIMAPLFIAMSLSFGMASFVLVTAALNVATREFLESVQKLIICFVFVVLLFTAIHHLTSFYASEHHGFERFLLLEGGGYTTLFWFGQVFAGAIIPLAMMMLPNSFSVVRLIFACALVVLGGFAQLYVIIVAGQVYPLPLFPGKEISSSFYDGVIASYIPAMNELALGTAGVALALLTALVAMRVLPFLPERHKRNPRP